MDLVLASSSPRRKELMTRLGYNPVRICSPDVDETPHKGEGAREYVKRVACDKVRAVEDEAYILAADTTVEANRKLMGKAFTPDDARKNLEQLSGKRHRVYTGICLKTPNGGVHHKVVMTRLTFKKLTEKEIEYYLTLDQWKGAAGSYMIQGYAEAFVKQINGSYSNVMGLPLYETKCLLEGAGCHV